MTCGATCECLFAFLDNELDAPLSIELQRHLDGCPACAREAEIERTVGKRLVGCIGLASATVPALDEFVAGVFAEGPEGFADFAPVRASRNRPPAGRSMGSLAGLFHRPRSLAAAAALVLLLCGGAWIILKDGESAGGSARFADLVVSDFEHFLGERMGVQVASADRKKVAEWLRAKTALVVVLPAPQAPGCRLVGGRKCKIADQPAAFAVYDLDGVPASLVAVAAEKFDLTCMEEVRRGGKVYRLERCRGFTVVAELRDGLVYAAVSKLAADELIGLMAGTAHESD